MLVRNDVGVWERLLHREGVISSGGSGADLMLGDLICALVIVLLAGGSPNELVDDCTSGTRTDLVGGSVV